MEVTITAKIRLLPTDDQANDIDACARAYTNALNYMSDEEFNFPASRTKNAQIHARHYSTIRDQFNLKSQLACSACKAVSATYKSIDSNKHKIKKPPKYKHAFYEAVRGRDYTFKDDFVSLNTLEEKRAKVRYRVDGPHADLLKRGKLGTAKVFKKHNKHYMHIPVTIIIEDDVAYDGETMIVGIDRGIRFLMTCYDSAGKTQFFSGKEVKEKRKQYKAKRREIQKKGTPSARRKLKKMGSRENRWMNDVNHCLSKALVESYPEGTVFVFEDLSNIRNALVKVSCGNRYEQVSWAYADLEAKIRYKAALRKQLVISVDPAYSSQECPVCGHKHKGNRDKKTHVFKCENCGFESNDDRTAAMVLLGRGREVLAELSGQDPDTPGSCQ